MLKEISIYDVSSLRMIKGTQNSIHLIIYFIFFLFAFWIIYIVINGNGGIVNREKLERELLILEEEIQELKKDKERLVWEINNLRSNRPYIEAFAREIGFKREGEIIFKFVKKEKSREY